VAFRRLVGAPASPVPEPILVFAAVLPWQFFSTALLEASSSLVGNSNLLSKVYFPRLIIPGAAVATAIADFLVTLALLATLMMWYRVAPSASLVVLPVFVVLSIGLSLGLGLLTAALNVQYRDFRYIVPFLVQMGLFVSPIAFTTADLPAQWRRWYALNPMVGIIDGFRWSILGDRVAIDPSALAVSASVTIVMLLLGVWYFRRMERSFADVI
jgi:lipopolysaccharide transport system permease protein